MSVPQSIALRVLVPVVFICAAMPFVIRAVLPDDPDFAYMGLGLGCGVLAALIVSVKVPVATPGNAGAIPRNAGDFGDGSSGVSEPVKMKDPRVAGMVPLFVLAFAVAAVFILFGAVPRADSGLPVSILALLTLTPGLGIVPYLTLRIRRPFAAVVFAAFIVASIKLASCVVVRFVYGPTALEDGYMAGDWQTARLMISLFWIGTLALSVALAIASRRLLLRKQFPVPA